MSSLLYGTITRKREEAPAGASKDDNPPGLNTYVDAIAALVPAEVLAVHAVIITFTTKTAGGSTSVTAPGPLLFWFWFLAGLAVVLYVIGLQKVPKGADFVRMLIPGLAFVAWTMLQPATAFDGVAPGLAPEWRTTIGLAGAIVLGLGAGVLGMRADKQPQSGRGTPQPAIDTAPQPVVAPGG